MPATLPEPAIPDAVTQFQTVPTLAPPQFAKLSSRIDSIEGANLAAATAGTRLTFEDSPPFRGSSGRPVRYTYAVVTEAPSARSDLSNLVSIVPLNVAAGPESLIAAAKPEGVVLNWPAPTTAASGGTEPVIVGYNIYRGRGSDVAEEFATPVNTTPATDTTYTDVPPYGEHEYRVTAVASAGPPRVESQPSPAATVTFKDLLPPPSPATVSVLVETRITRLVWDPVEAPDLKGYHVYRWQGTIRLKLTIGPAAQTFFGDESVEPGVEYRYTVTSVDTSGNESAGTDSRPFVVPRTP